MKKEKVEVRKSSGNVFKDLGLPYPERLLARSKIMSRIEEIIRERKLTQKEASAILGIPQSKVSCLMRGKLSMFSFDHLLELLNALDNDVDIIVRLKSKKAKKAITRINCIGSDSCQINFMQKY